MIVAESEARLYLADTGCLVAQELLHTLDEHFYLKLIKPYAFVDDYFGPSEVPDHQRNLSNSIRIRNWQIHPEKTMDHLIEAIESRTKTEGVGGVDYKAGTEKVAFFNGSPDQYQKVLKQVEAKGLIPLFTIIKTNGVHYKLLNPNGLDPEDHKKRIAIENVSYRIPGSETEYVVGTMAEIEVGDTEDPEVISQAMDKVLQAVDVSRDKLISIPMASLVWQKILQKRTQNLE